MKSPSLVSEILQRARYAAPADCLFYAGQILPAWIRARRTLSRRIDSRGLSQVLARLEATAKDAWWVKYCNAERHLMLAWLHAFELGLHRMPRKTILDIGTGAGYFAMVCEELGHDVIATDVDSFSVFNALVDFFRIDRRVWEVRPFTPAPDFGKPIDIVTAFAMDFDVSGCAEGERWLQPQWEYFLRDLAHRVIAPDGQAWFAIKRFPGGSGLNGYSPELFDFFARTGAEFPRKCRVVYRSFDKFRSNLPEPATDLRPQSAVHAGVQRD